MAASSTQWYTTDLPIVAGSNTTVTYGNGGVTIGATGSGSVTSVAAGAGLTASPSPITSSGTLSITAPVPIALGGTQQHNRSG